MLALMAFGLNGQNFAFNGYLPVKNPERASRIRFLEKRSESEMQSQIFIETPYRNHHLIETLLEVCKPMTRLCIAANITLENEWICTQSDPGMENTATSRSEKAAGSFYSAVLRLLISPVTPDPSPLYHIQQSGILAR